MAKKDLLMYAAIAIVILIAWQMFGSKKPATTSKTAPNLGKPSDMSGGPGTMQLTMDTGDSDNPFGLHL